MSRHLRDDALLDAAEDERAEGALAHLRECGECASKVEGIRRTLAGVRDAGAPEPSADYWDALRRQVARRVREESGPRRHSWLWVPGLALAAGALALAIALPHGVRSTPIRTVPAWSPAPADEDTVMTALQGLAPSGDDVAVAIGTTTVADELASLSDEERVEISRALRAEMKGSAL